jgi:hypothetical protein
VIFCEIEKRINIILATTREKLPIALCQSIN